MTDDVCPRSRLVDGRSHHWQFLTPGLTRIMCEYCDEVRPVSGPIVSLASGTLRPDPDYVDPYRRAVELLRELVELSEIAADKPSIAERARTMGIKPHGEIPPLDPRAWMTEDEIAADRGAPKLADTIREAEDAIAAEGAFARGDVIELDELLVEAADDSYRSGPPDVRAEAGTADRAVELLRELVADVYGASCVQALIVGEQFADACAFLAEIEDQP